MSTRKPATDLKDEGKRAKKTEAGVGGKVGLRRSNRSTTKRNIQQPPVHNTTDSEDDFIEGWPPPRPCRRRGVKRAAVKTERLEPQQQSEAEEKFGEVGSSRGEQGRPPSPSRPPVGAGEDGSDSAEEDSDWQDVEDSGTREDPELPTSPRKQPVISIDVPVGGKKKKSQREEMAAFIRRTILKIQKEITVDIHKTHLLCLIANGRKINGMLNSDILKSLAMSVVPQEFISTKSKVKKFSIESIEGVVKGLSARYRVTEDLPCSQSYTESELVKCFGQSELPWLAFVYLVVVTLRFVKVETRLCLSLRPLSIKYQPVKTKPSVDAAVEIPTPSKRPSNNPAPSNSHEQDIMRTLIKTEGVDLAPLGTCSSDNTVQQIDAVAEDIKSPAKKLKRKMELKLESNEGGKNINKKSRKSDETAAGTVSRNKRKSTNNVKYTEDSADEQISEYFKPQKSQKKDFTQKKSSKKKVKSPDPEGSNSVRKNVTSGVGRDVWIEVYVSSRWVSVDCVDVKYDEPPYLEKMSSKPLSYVIACDNEGHVKDVTKRYASAWLKPTGTRKLRADPDWLEETLKPLRPRNTKQNKMEDAKLEEKLQQQPLPSTVSEFKNHTLYVLPRHLLKFEALYPPECEILGYVRSEPVYSRDCVHLLHVRETWLKQARVVKIGEKPYKIVKGKKSRKQCLLDGNTAPKPVEIFGLWQTEEYDPPTAEGGIVPRNEYGNVDLFLPRMLPKHTVHLRIPGLNKVARKLDIDCAPAMVGWDFHGGWNHPVMDGFIVCEEHKDILLDAWKTECEILEEKEREKKEKRVFANWKLLLKGLKIREKLRKKYETAEQGRRKIADDDEGTAHLPSWPSNKISNEQEAGSDDESPKNMFPFEKL